MRNREELERLIVDASDGELSKTEIENLENELQNHPDLYQDYKAIMNLPDFSKAYREELETSRYQASIQKIQKSLHNFANEPDSFEMVTLTWFRRYALAASLAIFAVTSAYSFLQTQNEQTDTDTDNETVVEEVFYPVEESMADSYVLYFEDLTTDE